MRHSTWQYSEGGEGVERRRGSSGTSLPSLPRILRITPLHKPTFSLPAFRCSFPAWLSHLVQRAAAFTWDHPIMRIWSLPLSFQGSLYGFFPQGIQFLWHFGFSFVQPHVPGSVRSLVFYPREWGHRGMSETAEPTAMEAPRASKWQWDGFPMRTPGMTEMAPSPTKLPSPVSKLLSSLNLLSFNHQVFSILPPTYTLHPPTSIHPHIVTQSSRPLSLTWHSFWNVLAL